MSRYREPFRQAASDRLSCSCGRASNRPTTGTPTTRSGRSSIRNRAAYRSPPLGSGSHPPGGTRITTATAADLSAVVRMPRHRDIPVRRPHAAFARTAGRRWPRSGACSRPTTTLQAQLDAARNRARRTPEATTRGDALQAEVANKDMDLALLQAESSCRWITRPATPGLLVRSRDGQSRAEERP